MSGQWGVKLIIYKGQRYHQWCYDGDKPYSGTPEEMDKVRAEFSKRNPFGLYHVEPLPREECETPEMRLNT